MKVVSIPVYGFVQLPLDQSANCHRLKMAGFHFVGASRRSPFHRQSRFLVGVVSPAATPFSPFCSARAPHWTAFSDEAFCVCGFLESIILPSTVKTIGTRCFAKCLHLLNSPLPVDSEVVRIGDMAFECCRSLKSFVIPSPVEFVGENCFAKCDSLSHFAFRSPSHLREFLDVPRPFSGFVCIPDSVEILDSIGYSTGPCDQVLSFGLESRLIEIKPLSPRSDGSPLRRTFVRVSARSLKHFRMKLEFEPGM
jgi:hypothetical protein